MVRTHDRDRFAARRRPSEPGRRIPPGRTQAGRPPRVRALPRARAGWTRGGVRPGPVEVPRTVARGRRALGRLPTSGVLVTVRVAGRNPATQFTLTPFSAKYLIAPGCNGIGEAAFVWLLRSKFCASLWTRISSSRLSKIVFTMLYATWSGMSARAMIRFQTVTTWLG